MLFGRGDDLMYRCGIISPSGKASVLCCNDISELEDKVQELATEYDYMVIKHKSELADAKDKLDKLTAEASVSISNAQANLDDVTNLENIKYKFGNIKTIIFKNNAKFNKDELINEFKKISIKENDSNDILISFSLNEVNLDNLLLSLINKYKVEDFKINDISIEDITKELYENSKEN